MDMSRLSPPPTAPHVPCGANHLGEKKAACMFVSRSVTAAKPRARAHRIQASTRSSNKGGSPTSAVDARPGGLAWHIVDRPHLHITPTKILEAIRLPVNHAVPVSLTDEAQSKGQLIRYQSCVV